MKKIITTIICISFAQLFGCSDNYYYYNTNCNEGGNNSGDFETSTSGTGGSDTTASVSSSGSGGSDSAECYRDADCGPPQEICKEHYCENNQCVSVIKPNGTLVSDPILGDCTKSICDNGRPINVADDTDVSANSCLTCGFGELVDNCVNHIRCFVNSPPPIGGLYTCPLNKIDWTDSLGNTNHCDTQVILSSGTSCPAGNMCRVITATVSYIGVCE